MKTLFLGIAALIILTVVAALYSAPGGAQPSGGNALVPYMGSADLSFSYPRTYTLTERSDSFEGNPIRVLTFIDSSISVPDMSDGPEAISIIEVPNPQNLPLEQWVKEKSISNFSLSPDQKLSPSTLGGAPAVSYTHSGLYESKALAAEHNGTIYLVSVGSVNPGDAIYRDFQNIVNTLHFK